MILKKPTVTIGIPTFNEEKNIAVLLGSILAQVQDSYVLEKIVVACDGSTDATPLIVKSFEQKSPLVMLKKSTKRLGKTSRLNDIYKLNTSDLLLTLDADVVIEDANFISKLVSRFLKDERITVVAAHQISVTPRSTFIAKTLYVNYLMWEYVRMNIHKGQNIYNLVGSATMLRGSFVKNFSYPSEITCDEGYLYFSSLQKGKFYFDKEAIVLFRTADTLHDFILANTRSIGERMDLVPYFGRSILNAYVIPLHVKVKALVMLFMRFPFHVFFAIGINIYSRIFPKKDVLNQNGMWEQILSTKKVITHEQSFI